MNYRLQPPSPYGATVSTPALLSQVLGITGLGLCITALAAYLFRDMAPGLFSIAALIGGFILLFAIGRMSANEPVALLLFYVFTFLEGIGIAPTIAYYAHIDGPSIVMNAALTTGLGMLGLGAIVYATTFDFRRLYGVLMMALMAIILISIVSLFIKVVSPTAISWVVLFIFAGLTLADFARIRAGGSGSSAVMLAVSIYLDAINIFLALLQIFGGRRSND